jgi:hypothetical protein
MSPLFEGRSLRGGLHRCDIARPLSQARGIAAACPIVRLMPGDLGVAGVPLRSNK